MDIGICDLICLPVSFVGQRETRSSSEYNLFMLLVYWDHFKLSVLIASCQLVFPVLGFSQDIMRPPMFSTHTTLVFVSRGYLEPMGCQEELDPRVLW